MNKESPAFINIYKGELLSDEKIGEGFETGEMDMGRGVRRKKYQTGDGLFYYADRSLSSQKEAVRVMEVYRIMKEAGLPVVDFAKTVRKKIEGKMKYFLAMEDLTEDGKYNLAEVSESHASRLVENSVDPGDLQERMVQALAVMHNNRIVDFHPGLSFILRTEIKPYRGQRQEVDFRIMDYPNLITDIVARAKWGDDFDFEEECTKDLRMLLNGIIFKEDQKSQLEGLYKKTREVATLLL